jgi:type IV secretory pathway VirJ component
MRARAPRIGSATPRPASLPSCILRSAMLSIALWAGLAATTQAAPSIEGLPLVEIPGPRAQPTLVLFLSGDGGWRDLDKTIAERLAVEGLQVVGFDCLRYFWSERSPKELAEALERAMEHYRAAWGSERVVLAGYSFGADVLPAAMARLRPDLKAMVRELVLLGLSDRAEWVIHPGEWIGIQSPGDPVRPDAAQLDMRRVLCISGREEEVSLCRDPLFAAAERIETAGGHHFDGDYQGLAMKILASIRRAVGT